MTVAVAWVRRLPNAEELVFVSDSRLSGDGRVIDVCQKVLPLPRSDCAIAFAGYTGNAYPLVHQLASAIRAHEPLQRRSLDIKQVLKHALKIFDGMAHEISADAPEAALPEVSFLFGGYSWIDKQFELWRIEYVLRTKSFQALPAKTMVASSRAEKIFTYSEKLAAEQGFYVLGRIAFAGDRGDEALERLNGLYADRLKGLQPGEKVSRFDMEPFQVVRDMLRDKNKARSIGGAPQLVKVYQYMHSAPLAVFWPTQETGDVVLSGRPILGYERIDYWVLNPDTLQSVNLNYARAGAAEIPLREPDSEST